jgi:hypothetical protein
VAITPLNDDGYDLANIFFKYEFNYTENFLFIVEQEDKEEVEDDKSRKPKRKREATNDIIKILSDQEAERVQWKVYGDYW